MEEADVQQLGEESLLPHLDKGAHLLGLRGRRRRGGACVRVVVCECVWVCGGEGVREVEEVGGPMHAYASWSEATSGRGQGRRGASTHTGQTPTEGPQGASP